MSSSQVTENSPVQAHNKAALAFKEWNSYLTEMFEEKKHAIAEGRPGAGEDLMGKGRP